MKNRSLLLSLLPLFVLASHGQEGSLEQNKQQNLRRVQVLPQAVIELGNPTLEQPNNALFGFSTPAVVLQQELGNPTQEQPTPININTLSGLITTLAEVQPPDVAAANSLSELQLATALTGNSLPSNTGCSNGGGTFVSITGGSSSFSTFDSESPGTTSNSVSPGLDCGPVPAPVPAPAPTPGTMRR